MSRRPSPATARSAPDDRAGHGLGLFLAASATVLAAAADEKTITGDATCAKCALKEAKTCQNVVLVKDGDKEVKYYMDMTNPVAKEKSSTQPSK